MAKLCACVLIVLTVLPFTAPFATMGTPKPAGERSSERMSEHAAIGVVTVADADDVVIRARADFRPALKLCPLAAPLAYGVNLSCVGRRSGQTLRPAAADLTATRTTVLRI